MSCPTFLDSCFRKALDLVLHLCPCVFIRKFLLPLSDTYLLQMVILPTTRETPICTFRSCLLEIKLRVHHYSSRLHFLLYYYDVCFQTHEGDESNAYHALCDMHYLYVFLFKQKCKSFAPMVRTICF